MTLITLEQARAADACAEGYNRFRRVLEAAHPGLTAGGLDKVQFSVGDVAAVDLSDAIWCLRFVSRREAAGAVMPAVRRASVHATDALVHYCIAEVDRWLGGDDTVDLRAAKAAARAADSARAAESEQAARAARAAADAAAWAAACAEERVVPLAARAGRAAALAVAWAASEAWVWRAEHKAQVADLIAAFPRRFGQETGE